MLLLVLLSHFAACALGNAIPEPDPQVAGSLALAQGPDPALISANPWQFAVYPGNDISVCETDVGARVYKHAGSVKCTDLDAGHSFRWLKVEENVKDKCEFTFYDIPGCATDDECHKHHRDWPLNVCEDTGLPGDPVVHQAVSFKVDCFQN
ncbi:MAG: hypothetical protein M1835_004519 [Candelina submexicana]|nr:MAG: hypothetical protein M1835_004519 [Candelina submexicana]